MKRRSGTRKDTYDEIHSPIVLAQTHHGDDVMRLSNLESKVCFHVLLNASSSASSSASASLSASAENSLQNRSLQIKCYKAPLPNEIHQQCLDLFLINMRSFYENSKWGLDLESKNEELAHEHARFLIVTMKKEGDDTTVTNEQNEVDDDEQQEEENDVVVAFAHFRFECGVDECNDSNFIYNTTTCSTTVSHHDIPLTNFCHEPILYLYEIQIHPTVQRKNIGKKIMNLLEIFAMKMSMAKIMLTVFKSNTKAIAFYKKLEYKIDETSPDYVHYENQHCCINHNEEEQEDYVILSKGNMNSVRVH